MDVEVNGGPTASDGRRPWWRLAIGLVPAAVVLGIAFVLAWSAWPLLSPAREVRVAQAVFAQGGDRDVAESGVGGRFSGGGAGGGTVQAAGWLEAEPYVVACTALADGVVESIGVLAGEFVEEGDVVARLVAEDSEIRLRRAEAELVGARAALAMAAAELAAAERSWEEPIELERRVDSGRAALAEARGEVERLPALVERARAMLVLLREEFERAERSRLAQASTEIELIVARQRVAAQEAEVDAVEARRPVLDARVDRLASELRAAERDLSLRIEDRRRLGAARAAVDAARAAVDRAVAERDEAALELDRMVIRAPISGFVQRRLKSPGDKVIRMMDDPTSAQVLHLYDRRDLQVRVDVPLADASRVFAGQRCEVVVEVLPGRVFEGEVLRSTHEADIQKNTLEFKVRVLDPAPILRPEMLTRVKFLPGDGAGDVGGGSSASSSAGSGVLVPSGAIDGRGGSARVWLVEKRRGGRGELRPVGVEVLGRREGWVFVGGGVSVGSILSLDFDGARAGQAVEMVGGGMGGAS